MITEIQIKNFKAWQDTGSIKLAPLTVLFGTNSSGKSSVSQLLLLLKQTAESPDRRRILHFGDRGSLLDVGTFADLIHNHETDRSLEFRFGWDTVDPLSIVDSRRGISISGTGLSFESEIRQEDASGRLRLQRFQYSLAGGSDQDLAFGVHFKGGTKRPIYELTSKGFLPVRLPGRPWPLRDPVRFYGFPDETVAYYNNVGFLPDFALELERQMIRLFYLGPLRQIPDRTYVWSGEVPAHVGWSGERTVEAILAASDRSISPGYRRRYVPFQSLIASWLKRLGLISEFHIKPVTQDRKEYEALIKVGSRSPEVTLVDVGFGVSQVLPVVVDCFYAPRHSTVVMEQPEIHLHPKVQAGLADLFAETIRSREEGRDRNIQLLIESHSEHFLRRLQTLVASEKLSTDDVAIYFCDASSARLGRIRELELDLFGRIANWPRGFFGDLAGEAEERARFTLRRHAQERDG